MPPPPTLSALRIYPVKSCAGIEPAEADVGLRGLVDDRRWMVVDASGRFVSQREEPRMCFIRPDLEGGVLRLRAPGADPLRLPGDGGSAGGGRRLRVRVWGDECDAVDQGEVAARWLSRLLGRECRLVRQADEDLRSVDPAYTVKGEDRVSFADAFPFLLASEASLADLNRRLDEPVAMERFRPNLVVAGARAFEEDRWKTLRIGDVVFTVAKPCARCAVTTVDPETGGRGKEPLRTLATFRRGAGGGVEFGWNLIHHGPGTLRVGSEVEVLERR